ncbi:hypothetical protein KC19_1G268700 [Ceratodon purpureus]|uniref:RING-type domain-containing protein n=1 Tax=Ceratodon purpureus TaxID=3225 RepID=A0A8T0JD48_CERPU|nr:hypothetical protein KC19_1G268700 [Ceratodon purpureus]
MAFAESTTIVNPLGVGDFPGHISSLALRFVEDYAKECNSATTPSVTVLSFFSDVLQDATEAARKGEASSLNALCCFLPAAIKRTMTGALSREEEFQAYLFEVLYWFLELVEATFASGTGDLATQAIKMGPNISQLLVALCDVLNSKSKFYGTLGRKRGVLVCPWRFKSLLQVPGVFVKVSGGHEHGQVYYFCSQKGVSWSGNDGREPRGCLCCVLPAWADPVLFSLTSILNSKVASGGGHELMLRMLCYLFNFFETFSLPTISLLLRPLCELLNTDTGSNSWREVIPQIETNSKIEFKDLCSKACSKLFQTLDDMIPVELVNPCSSLEVVRENHEAFSDIIKQLHTITCWGVKHYGGTLELIQIRDSLSKLQERTWERFLDLKWHSSACESIGAAMAATLTPTRGKESLFSLKWLEEKNIINRFLDFVFRVDYIFKVKDFLALVAKKGVVLEEKDFLALITYSDDHSDDEEDYEFYASPDLMAAVMLDELDTSAYSAGFLERVLKWLESRQVDSVIYGSRIFFILRKLLTNDKERTWEKRFLTLMKKHSAGVREKDLVDCLCDVSDHYTSHHGIEPVKDTHLQPSDQQAKLLQACSSADMTSCISTDMGDVLKSSKEHFEKEAETWKSQELDLHATTSSELAKTLAIDFPMTRHETAKKCLDRLVLAKSLSINVDVSETSMAPNVMVDAMAAELQVLEALKEESFLHCNVIRQVEELGQKHAEGYDALRQEQHTRLEKYLEVCRKEKEDVIWEALYQKAKVLASMKRASLGTDEDLSAEDILKRLFQKSQDALREMVGKQRESLERVPNSSCVVCFDKFSQKRKRACLEPCGHASACIDCTTQEWKRTKKCPICVTDISKPIPIPFKLFF